MSFLFGTTEKVLPLLCRLVLKASVLKVVSDIGGNRSIRLKRGKNEKTQFNIGCDILYYSNDLNYNFTVCLAGPGPGGHRREEKGTDGRI